MLDSYRATTVKRRLHQSVRAILGAAIAGSVVLALFTVPPEYGLSWVAVYGVASTAVVVGLIAWESVDDPTPAIASVDLDGAIKRSTNPLDEGVDADDVVDAIEDADDGDAEALLVRCNSPGGAPVASEDLRTAIRQFDGPTVAFAQDVCASGAYLAACGADEIVARPASLVGSIGVTGSQVHVDELADQLGVTYESLSAGEYKDAGTPLRGLEDDERAYLQSLVDEQYDLFVERVASERDLDEETVRGTEARVLTGATAAERGLVDATGDEEAARDRLREALDPAFDVEDTSDVPLEVDDVTPSGSPLAVSSRVGEFAAGLAGRVGSAFASGAVDRLSEREGPLVEYRDRK